MRILNPVESAEQKLNAALLTLAYLGRCGRRGYVAHKEIAQRHNLGTGDVVNLVRSLADAGLVNTRLGRRGGVSISRPLNQISIEELYEVCQK